MSTKQKILITVMTYPHPSEGYQELVCTAGINEAKEWVRLYPVDYRYRPRGQQFRKYQWIEVELDRHDKDNRPESWRPISIQSRSWVSQSQRRTSGETDVKSLTQCRITRSTN